MFDIQGHLLEYHLNPVLNGQNFWQSFPQKGCGEDDPRVCYSIEHFLELMFLRSDTNMLVLSSLPIFPEGSPLSPEIMDITRRTVEGLCRDERILLHAQALPNVGTQRAALDAMEHTAGRYPVAAWKTFTHFPGAFEGDGNVWWLDDRDGGDLGERFIRKAVDLGIPTICTHKGLSLGTPNASPDDIGPVARRHPDVNFVAYHSGFEAGDDRGAVHAGDRPSRREPADRLDGARGHRPERERLRGDRLVLVVRDALPGPGGALPRQAAEARRRGQRAVGDRLPVLRVAAAADPGDAHLPDLRGVPRAATATRSSRRS